MFAIPRVLPWIRALPKNDFVLFDRAAERSVEVVDAGQRQRRLKAGRLQFRREVAALEGFTRHAVEDGARVRVPTRLRHDVHHQSGRFGFAETARRRERHFLRVAHVGHVCGGLVASGRVADVQSIDRHAAFVVASAVNRKLRR